MEKLEGDDSLALSGDSVASDQLPEDALGETNTTTETTTTTTESSPADQATTEQTDVATSTETLPADPFASTDTPSSDTTAMVESSTSTDSSTTVVDSGSAAEETPKKANVPLQKVATAPWKVGKTWFNTVYFARPGDSLSSISQMIYGADKTKELKKGNPTFSSRDVKPGEKVYYNSPHRTDDSSRIITYYEDNGIAAQTYVAKPGDNIREVAKNVLGYDNAWKEVWSTNAVDSKGMLTEGTELRYWPGTAVAAAPSTPAANPEIAGSGQGQTAPPPMEQQAPSLPPPPSFDEAPPQQAQGEIPPPPMPDQAQQDMAMAPPPPPEEHMAPPPPPPPVEAINPPAPQQHAEEAAPTGMDNDTTMALAVVGLAAAGLAILIVMRKKEDSVNLISTGSITLT